LRNWIDIINEFNFEIEHISGIHNTLPDHLSRLVSVTGISNIKHASPVSAFSSSSSPRSLPKKSNIASMSSFIDEDEKLPVLIKDDDSDISECSLTSSNCSSLRPCLVSDYNSDHVPQSKVKNVTLSNSDDNHGVSSNNKHDFESKQLTSNSFTSNGGKLAGTNFTDPSSLNLIQPSMKNNVTTNVVISSINRTDTGLDKLSIPANTKS
jgi:hypothetical protein